MAFWDCWFGYRFLAFDIRELSEMLEENWSVPTRVSKQHMTVLAYKEAIDQGFIEEDEM